MGSYDTTVVNQRSEGPSAARDPDATLARGSRLGRYLVLGELGRGGMGVVYRAYDPELDRPLALKRLRQASAPPDSPAHARLRREAQTLARLSDPHVVAIYDVGEDETGLFIAMELLEGEDLAEWLSRGPHPWPEVIERFAAAGRGLAAAHRVGVVHRDFKPANVLLGEDGRVAVTDFGLARPESSTTGDAPASEDEDEDEAEPTAAATVEPVLTEAGVRVGTPAYMAPEQHAGEAADVRADQFAFCVALFEGLYGRRPFVGESPPVLAGLKRKGVRHWPDDESLPRPVPARLRRLLARGLDPDPDRRFSSMDALLDRLEPDDRRRRGWAVAAVGALAVTAIVGVLQSADDDDPCAASDQALEEVWGDELRARVDERLRSIERPFAEQAATMATEGLDAWAEGFVGAHREICEATWRRGEQSARALDHRMQCLEDRRLALEATVQALVEADAQVAEHTRSLVMGLPDPEICRDLDPGPASGAVAAGPERSRLGRRLAELDAMRRSGRGREALEQAEPLAAEVGASLDPRTGAAFFTLLGILRDDGGDFAGARQALEQAARLARSHGDAKAEAEAWIELTRVAGTHLHDADEGERFGALALAAVEAAGDDPELRAHARLELGEVAFRAGRDDRTLEHWTEAERLRTELFGEDDVRVAQVQARLAGVDLRRGDMDRARQRLETVIERYQAALGPGHPRMAAPLGNLGFVLSAQGEHDAALAHMRRATEIAVHSRGPHHPQVAGGHDAIGHVLLMAGRPAEAEPELRAAVDGFDRSLGPSHPAVAAPLLALGQTLLALDRPAEAVAPLERGLALADAADLPPIETADTRFALARALVITDPARARALARDAIATYEEILRPEDERWAQVRAFREAMADATAPAP